MKSPAITTTLEGKNKTLYLQVIYGLKMNVHFIINYNYITVSSSPSIYYYNCHISVYSFIFQSVKSIEERTRPNLCKTLKGNNLSSDQIWLSVAADNHDLICVFNLSGCRAGPVGRTGTSRGRHHHTPDGSLQAQFHHLNVHRDTRTAVVSTESQFRTRSHITGLLRLLL